MIYVLGATVLGVIAAVAYVELVVIRTGRDR